MNFEGKSIGNAVEPRRNYRNAAARGEKLRHCENGAQAISDYLMLNVDPASIE